MGQLIKRILEKQFGQTLLVLNGSLSSATSAGSESKYQRIGKLQMYHVFSRKAIQVHTCIAVSPVVVQKSKPWLTVVVRGIATTVTWATTPKCRI